MKKLFLIPLLIFNFVILSQSKVSAEACVVNENTPSATINLPDLAGAGKYSIWSRIQTPNVANSRFLLEVNSEQCFIVFNAGPVNQWVWVNTYGSRSDTKNLTHDFIKMSGNSIKLIALDNGVKVDRLLILKDDCVPEGTGDNCRVGATTLPVQPQKQSIEQDPSGPIKGKVFVSSLLSETSKDVSKVEYYVDGKKVQVSSGITPFDTTLVDNGTRTITTRVYYDDGTTEDVINTVKIQNPLNTFSPLKRWLRLNQQLMWVIGSVSALVAVFILVYSIAKYTQRKSKNKRAHGF